MNTLLQSPWLERIGWALLHSLWQGALIWSAVALLLVMRRGLSAARKHQIAWLAVTLLAFSPALTVAWLARESAAGATSTFVSAPTYVADINHESASAPVLPERPAADIAMPALASSKPAVFSRRLFSWLVFAWMAGVVVLTLRLVGGWFWLRRLGGQTSPLDVLWTQRVDGLCRKVSLPRVRVLAARSLGIPIIVGWLRPVIHLPVSMMTGLKPAEVEAVLLHELAHLKRHDPVLRLWITIVETLLFYHPAAHALGNMAHHAAEEACDDLVLQWTGDGRSYAQALASLEEWRGSRLALAGSGGLLRQRLRRILGLPEETAPFQLQQRFGVAAFGGLALYLVLCGIGVPQIARALTPQERMATIDRKRAETGIDVPHDQLKEITAVGQVRFLDGVKPAKPFYLHSHSPGLGDAVEVTGLTDIKIRGKGAQIAVSGWPRGFAPAETPMLTPDPKTGQAAFDLAFERGYPALFEVVDEAGHPVVGAQVIFQATLPSGEQFGSGNLVTDAVGQTSPGNATAGIRFQADVLAHGFQWKKFEGLSSTPGQSTVLQVVQAQPIIGEIVDAKTGNPVAGCHVHCLECSTQGGSHVFVGSNGPELAALPSDSNGRVAIDVARPEDGFKVMFLAPNHQRQTLRLEPGTRHFRMELKPAIALSGVIHDPDHLLEIYGDGKTMVVFYFNGQFDIKEFPAGPDGVPFYIDQLPEGKLEISCGNHIGGATKWTTDLKKTPVPVSLTMTKLGLVNLSEPAPVPPPARQKRKLDIVFDLPPGAPPLKGRATLLSTQMPIKLQIAESHATVELPVPSHATFTPKELSGWIFSEKKVEITKGDEPLVVHLTCVAAGALSGRIIGSASTGTRFAATVLLTEAGAMPDGSPWKDFPGGGLDHFDDTRRFFASPLPLNGGYRVLAWTGYSFAETPVLRLDEAHPFLEQDITFPEGVSISGTLLGPDQKPADGVDIFLRYSEGGRSFAGRGAQTAGGGKFQLRGVNFAMAGRCFVGVIARRGCAPLEIPLTAESRDVKLQLQAGLPVDVVLVDAQDHPVKGALLRAYPGPETPPWGYAKGLDRITADEPSDAEGRAHFSSFPPGVYRINMEDYEELQVARDKPEALDNPVITLPHSSAEPLRLRVVKH